MKKPPEKAEYRTPLEKYIKQLMHRNLELKERVKQLKIANELKNLSRDIMTHDLLNPVSIIKNASEMMLEDDSIKNKPEVKMINKSALRLQEMIEDASKLAKLENPEQLEYKIRDLNPIFRKVVEDFYPLLKEKKMELKYMADGKYPAYVNPYIIKDVFSNLISNAIKYSPEESEITCGIEDGNGSWKIYVKDRGIGVEDEYKTKIFERFYRIEKEGVKGSGLGLSIVKRTVELHKGRVWVEDNLGGGSIFYVELPKYNQR